MSSAISPVAVGDLVADLLVVLMEVELKRERAMVAVLVMVGSEDCVALDASVMRMLVDE